MGGARNRSGPAPDPMSLRSDRRGLVFAALPRDGFSGEVPAFPLPPLSRYRWEFEGKRRFQVLDPDETKAFRERELEVWAESWRTPQACVWAVESWRHPTLAEFCRIKVAVEFSPDSNASLIGQLHRYRDQLGLTPAGMKDNGWKLADEIEAGRMPVDSGQSVRRRLRALEPVGE